ncbi:MAG: hypothetical protein V4439_02715 [Patescibacteria group bacterium]
MGKIPPQILGIILATTTAIGCIAYEKLVKNFSIGIIILLALLFYVPAIAGIIFFNKETLSADVVKLIHNKTFITYAIIYVLTWATVPLWYIITKNQGILVGSIYEVKYIVVLAVFYIFWGEKTFTAYTAAGLLFALASIYFISK